MGYAARPQGVQPDSLTLPGLEGARSQSGALQRLSRRRPDLGPHLGAAGFQIKVFFLLCVAIAGLYGAATASRKILFIQTVPARWSP